MSARRILPSQSLSTSRSVLIPSSFKLSNTTTPYTAIATIAKCLLLVHEMAPQPHGDAGKNPQRLTPTKVDSSMFLPNAGEATDAYRSWLGKLGTSK